MAGTHAARDHTHALFRTGSHSFLGNGATLFSRFRQCSHTAVEDLAVIVPDLRDLDLPKPRYLRLWPQKFRKSQGKLRLPPSGS
jgi:hypothetical protein